MLRPVVFGVLISCLLTGFTARAKGPEPIETIPADIEELRRGGVAAAKDGRLTDALQNFVAVHAQLVRMNRVSCAITLNLAHVLNKLDRPREAYLFYWKTLEFHKNHGARCGREFSEKNLNWLEEKLEELADGFRAENLVEYQFAPPAVPSDPTRGPSSSSDEVCTLSTDSLEDMPRYPPSPPHVFFPLRWWFRGNPGTHARCGNSGVDVDLEGKQPLPDNDTDTLLGPSAPVPQAPLRPTSGGAEDLGGRAPGSKETTRPVFAFWKQPGFWLAAAGVISTGVGAWIYDDARRAEQRTLDTFSKDYLNYVNNPQTVLNPVSELIDQHHPRKTAGTWMMGLGVSAAVVGGTWLIVEGVRWNRDGVDQAHGILRSIHAVPIPNGLVLGADIGF